MTTNFKPDKCPKCGADIWADCKEHCAVQEGEEDELLGDLTKTSLINK